MTTHGSAAREASAKLADSFLAETLDTAVARRASHDLGIEPVTPAAAQFLTLLCRSLGAQAVAEIGTGAGVATLAFFAGMAEGGIVTSIDQEAQHQMAARDALKAAGVPHTRYRLITGEAVAVLPKLRAGAYDLIFIDADPMEYPEYLEEALRIVRPGGLVILNHVLLGGKVADETNFDDDTMIMRDTLEAARAMDQVTSALVPIGDGFLICVTEATPATDLA